jgi:3-oxoacyl-[acyl-carrier-protein] synthase II
VALHITASAIRSCFVDGERTFAALLNGANGASGLRHVDARKVNVTHGYHIQGNGAETLLAAGEWLADCVRDVIEQASLDPSRDRIATIIGTGLRELRAVERAALEPLAFEAERLHFAGAVRQVCPGIACVITLSNACSADRHALALAQDLVELEEMDAVVAAGVDGMTESMLAMIGRFVLSPPPQVWPFDRECTGALLGEGAAALVVTREGSHNRPCARLLGTALSCDAGHETAPVRDGIRRAIRNAFELAGRSPADVDLVVAHGTGTALNDPTEASLLDEEFGSAGAPLITGPQRGAGAHVRGGCPDERRCGPAMHGHLSRSAHRRTAGPDRRGGDAPARPGPSRARGRPARADQFVRIRGRQRRDADPGCMSDVRWPATRIAVTAWSLHVPGPPLDLLDGGVADEPTCSH